MLLRNLFRRKGRTVLTIGAVAISTALLLSMLSIAEGLYTTTVETVNRSKEDILITTQEFENGIFDNGIENGHLLAGELAGNKNYSMVSPFGLGAFQTLVPGEDNKSKDLVFAMGFVPEAAEGFLSRDRTLSLFDLEITFDGWFEVPDDPHYENGFTGPWTEEVLIDEIFAEKNDADIGSTIHLTPGPVNQSRAFRVVGKVSHGFTSGGLVSDILGGLVILHLSELQSMIGDDVFEQGGRREVKDKILGVSIALDKGLKEDDPGSVRKNAKWLQKQYPYYNVLTKEDMLDLIEQNVLMAQVFYLAVGSVSLVIGLLFVCAIMIMSVYERTKEIGVLRAIGISRFSIFRNILLESMVLVTLGSVLGIAPGILGSKIINAYLSKLYGYSEAITVVSPSLIIQNIVLVVVVGVLFSIFPAYRATKINIVKAFREG